MSNWSGLENTSSSLQGGNGGWGRASTTMASLPIAVQHIPRRGEGYFSTRAWVLPCGSSGCERKDVAACIAALRAGEWAHSPAVRACQKPSYLLADWLSAMIPSPDLIFWPLTYTNCTTADPLMAELRAAMHVPLAKALVVS